MLRRSLPPDLLAAISTMDKRLAFEREVSATPIGRQSFRLRQRAQHLVATDREPEAFKLYEEAASPSRRG